MKRTHIAMLALTALITAAPVAASAADVSVRIGTRYDGDRLTFRREPRTYVVPRTRVYRANYGDRDLYRYGDHWYYVEDGTWYQANSWRGPFVSIGFSTVPHQVRVVPSGYRRNWGSQYDNGYNDRDQMDRDNHRGY